MKNIRKFKVLQDVGFLKVGTLIIEMEDYYEGGGFKSEKIIVENCPTVFEEVFEKPYETIEDVSGNIFSIIRKSDGQIFKIGDNISLKDMRGWYIIDEFVIKDGELFIVETDEDGEDKHIINVLEELGGMSLEISSNDKSQEILDILEKLQTSYIEIFRDITNLLNK